MRTLLRKTRSPELGSIRWARICSNVDLPEPLGPIKPRRSPSLMVNDTLRNKGATPKDFETLLVLSKRATEEGSFLL
jgi:hypothetical protein